MTSYGCQTALFYQTKAVFPEQAAEGNVEIALELRKGGRLPQALASSPAFAEQTQDTMGNDSRWFQAMNRCTS